MKRTHFLMRQDNDAQHTPRQAIRYVAMQTSSALLLVPLQGLVTATKTYPVFAEVLQLLPVL